jgi:hypothetical protein
MKMKAGCNGSKRILSFGVPAGLCLKAKPAVVS